MTAKSVSRALTGIVLLLTLLVSAGCAFVDEDIMLRPSSRVAASTIGEGQQVAVTVIDERPSTMIGIRGHMRTAEIRAVQDVGRVVNDAVNQGLANQGFEPVADTGAEPVTLEVQIRALSYDATSGFWTGGVYTNAALKVVARNGDDSFEQMYRSAAEDRAFITPMASEDAAQINQVLSNVIDQVLSDQQLLGFLAESTQVQPTAAAPGS